MADQHLTPAAETGGEGFHQVHRPVPAAGAADCHSEIAAAVALEARQPFGDEAVDVLVHLLTSGFGAKEVDHGPVQSGKVPQVRIVVRVRQTEYVQHQVCVERNAVLVAERLEQQGKSGGGRGNEVLDPVAQHVCGEVAGIHSVREVGETG